MSQLIKTKVTELLSDSNSKVINILATKEADAEIAKRVEWTTKGIEELEKLTKELNDQKPDNVMIDPLDKTKRQEGWSKKTFEEREKKEKRKGEIESALTLALDASNNFEPLKKLYGKGNNQQQSGGTSEKSPVSE